jgi:hypothetical protein
MIDQRISLMSLGFLWPTHVDHFFGGGVVAAGSRKGLLFELLIIYTQCAYNIAWPLAMFEANANSGRWWICCPTAGGVRVRSKLVRLNYAFTSLAISQGPKQTNSRTKFFFFFLLGIHHSFFFSTVLRVSYPSTLLLRVSDYIFRQFVLPQLVASLNVCAHQSVIVVKWKRREIDCRCVYSLPFFW